MMEYGLFYELVEGPGPFVSAPDGSYEPLEYENYSIPLPQPGDSLWLANEERLTRVEGREFWYDGEEVAVLLFLRDLTPEPNPDPEVLTETELEQLGASLLEWMTPETHVALNARTAKLNAIRKAHGFDSLPCALGTCDPGDCDCR